MLEVNDNIYLFDGGAPLGELIIRKGKSLTSVKAFFNSHFHADHISGAIKDKYDFEIHVVEDDDEYEI